MATRKSSLTRVIVGVILVFAAGVYLGKCQAKHMREDVAVLPTENAINPIESVFPSPITEGSLFTQPPPKVERSVTREFAQKINHAQSLLPTRQSVAKIPAEELHRHAHLIPFADAMGEVVAELERETPVSPEKLAAALGFLQDCGQNADAVSAVREQCVANWINWHPRGMEEAPRFFDQPLIDRARRGITQ